MRMSFLVVLVLVGRMGAQGAGLLTAMQAAAKGQRTLRADVVMTWNGGGSLKRTAGTVELRKPNLAVIRLAGDFPLRELVSDGKTRVLAEDQTKFTREAMDANGAKVDSPWWGLPFRFFFTQSVNPFGAVADPAAVYEDLGTEMVDGVALRVLGVKGGGPMGAYTGRFSFAADGVLVRSVVQFGEGPGAAKFEAVLSHVRVNEATRNTDFTFVPVAGQTLTTTAAAMLEVGVRAPEFRLRGPDGSGVSLGEVRRGKKATLVNFWYYDCAPCRIEFPEFETLYQRFQAQGLGVVAIDKGDNAKTVADYVRRTGLTFPVAMGGEVTAGSVFARYQVTEQFPGTYLLDGEGKIVYRSVGADLAGLKAALAKLGFQ